MVDWTKPIQTKYPQDPLTKREIFDTLPISYPQDSLNGKLEEVIAYLIDIKEQYSGTYFHIDLDLYVSYDELHCEFIGRRYETDEEVAARIDKAAKAAANASRKAAKAAAKLTKQVKMTNAEYEAYQKWKKER